MAAYWTSCCSAGQRRRVVRELRVNLDQKQPDFPGTHARADLESIGVPFTKSSSRTPGVVKQVSRRTRPSAACVRACVALARYHFAAGTGLPARTGTSSREDRVRACSSTCSTTPSWPRCHPSCRRRRQARLVIRPLACAESDIADYAQHLKAFPIIPTATSAARRRTCSARW